MGVLRSLKLLSIIKGIVKSDFENTSELMGGLHGLPQKLGQHLTLYFGTGSGGYFGRLCTESKMEQISAARVLHELRQDYRDCQCVAQASIGQVYRVETGSGTLALKVRYPGVAGKIKGDFRLLKALLLPVRFLPLKNGGLIPLIHDLEALILRECDYEREAEVQNTFHRLFREDDTICVPEVMAYNDQAIISQWIRGAGPNLSELAHDSRFAHDCRFAETYLKFFLNSLKETGMVHADPHPGNFIITAAASGSRLAVLDFGSVVRFTGAEKQALTRLLLGEYETEKTLVDDMLQLGVTGEILEQYETVIGDLVSILLEPFYFRGNYDFRCWRLQYKLNTILASRAWERPLAVPPRLLLLVRTIQGLYFYARNRSALINWHDHARRFLLQ